MKFQITFGTINSDYKANYEILDIIEANNQREAVEQFYAKKHDDKYFPQEDGYICDADGWVIADDTDTTIKYNGGRYGATLID